MRQSYNDIITNDINFHLKLIKNHLIPIFNFYTTLLL